MLSHRNHDIYLVSVSCILLVRDVGESIVRRKLNVLRLVLASRVQRGVLKSAAARHGGVYLQRNNAKKEGRFT